MVGLCREAWRAMWVHPLRAGLTMLGIGWGLFAEMLMLSLGVGLYQTMLAEFGQTGANRMALYPQFYKANEVGPPKIKQTRLEPEDIDAIRTHARTVRGIEPEVWIGDRAVRVGQTVAVADVYGLTPTIAPVRNFSTQYGRFFSPADIQARRRVCTLGTEVARKLDLLGPHALGRRVVIDGIPLAVIGVMGGHPDQLSRMHSADDDQVYMPISTAQRYFTGTNQDYWTVNFEPLVPEQYQEAGREVRAIVAARQGFDPRVESAVWVFGIFDMMKMIYFMALGLKLFLGVAGAVTVFVGGVGVMNIMSVSIAERTNEIGLRKALGAAPSDIFWQFFIEALLMTGVAAGVAFSAGLALVAVCSRITMPRFVPAPILSPGLALFLLGLTVAVGVFAGTRPAMRAARLHPADALRHA